jgi:predicted RNA-binding protein
LLGEYHKSKLEVGNLVNYKKKLHLLVDFFVKNGRIWFAELKDPQDNLNQNKKVPVVYLYKINE